MLTSSDNTITLDAGYYDSVTISTDITSLTGTITYTHHQCSNTTANLTYTDTLISATGAESVSETTVNGQTVSTSKGGCYTTPYYYYSVYHAASSTTTTCGGGYHQEGYAGKSDGGSYPVYVCNTCGYTQVGGVWGTHTRTVTTPAYYTYHYGTSYSGSLLRTYYLKTCGYTNGQLLSATITY